MKKIILLGSTGSIGTQTLSVVDAYPEQFEVVGIACGTNYTMLNQQIERYRPKYVYIDNNADKLEPKGAKIVDSLEELVRIDADIVVTAVVGIAGLKPTIEAIKCGKDIALANKETLVACGELVMRLAREKGVNILPVDSEHSALWQCSDYSAARNIKKLILTASGGAFRNMSAKQLESVTLDDALQHPTWKMGRKVTIDSASMMNKGLEVIEAMHLFGINVDNIDVLVHKQSIVHSLVMYEDNSIIAQLSKPSMVLPIQLALTYPDRMPSSVGELDLAEIGALNFERVDMEVFRCLGIAYQVGRTGGTSGAIMNAANEIAVEAFISNKIKFSDIPYCIETALNKVSVSSAHDYFEVMAADMAARNAAIAFVNAR